MGKSTRQWLAKYVNTFAYRFLSFSIIFSVFQVAQLSDRSFENIVTTVAIDCAAGAAVAGLGMRSQKRRDEKLGITSMGQRIEITEAIRTGELPSSTETKRILPNYLHHLATIYTKNQKQLPIIAIFFVALSGWLTVSEHNLLWLALGLFFVFEVLFILRKQRKLLTNIQKLSTKL